MPYRGHAGRLYSISAGYLGDEDAWMLELSEAKPAPASWSTIPGAGTHLPGDTFLTAMVPDEDPKREPTLHLYAPEGHEVPYEIMLWFMENVAAEVARCRAEMEQMHAANEGDC
jgi:hypothetical protein